MATERLKTIKPSGGDYTSLSAAEAGEDDYGDLVSRDEWMHFSCYAMQDTATVIIDGWTTDSTRYILVDTPSTERHDGKWNASKYRMEVNAWAAILESTESYTKITGLQFKYTGSGNENMVQLTAGGTFSYNIMYDPLFLHSYLLRIGAPTDIFNNLFYQNSVDADLRYGIRSYSWSVTSSKVYNNTFQNMNVGIIAQASGNNVLAKNNLFRSVTTPCSGTFSAGTDYNATDAASMGYTVTGGGNTHDRLNQTFTFVDEAADDFHLASSDAGAKDYGVSDPGSGLFSDDIDGQTRSGSWDIGADEYIAAGGGPVIPVFMNQYRQRWA